MWGEIPFERELHKPPVISLVKRRRTYRHDPLVSNDALLRNLTGDWRQYLVQQAAVEDLAVLRKEVLVNRPVGDDRFILRLEKRFGCIVRRQIPGRPPEIDIN